MILLMLEEKHGRCFFCPSNERNGLIRNDKDGGPTASGSWPESGGGGGGVGFVYIYASHIVWCQ